MTDQPESPPAFPRDHRHLGHNGMTLRDYFAGKAFQSVIDAERERCAGIVNERDALMQALVAAHEDNLWNEYHTGSVRDGRWTHMFMSDGECLALDCGFDPKNADYPDDAIRAAIPAAAERRAQDALFAIRGSTNEH